MPYLALRPLLSLVVLFNLALHSQSISDVRRRGDGPANPMDRARVLGGAVYTRDGVPVPGAWITIRNLQSGEVVFSGATAADGGFEASVESDRSYEVLARSDAQEDRAIAEGDNAMSLRMTLPVRSGQISRDGASVSLADLQAPPRAQQVLQKAKECLRKNDAAGARKQLEKAIRAYPDYPTALALLARSLSPHGGEEALRLANRAAALAPQDGFARAILAGLLNDARQPDAALQEADAAIVNASQAWHGHFERARALAARGSLNDALTSAVRADELAQGHVLAVRVARTRLLAALGRQEEAREQMDAFILAASDKNLKERAAAEKLAISSFAKK